MMRRLGPRRDGGAGLAEYAGLVVLAALILGALVALGLPSKVEAGVSSAICQIFQGSNCGKPEAGGQNDGGQKTGGPDNGGQNSGNQNTGDQNGGDDGDTSLADLQKQADDAQKAADDANGKYGNIKQQIIDLLKDFIGITDIEECISKGSISSCLWAAFDIASWVFAALKIAKFAKAVKDAIKLYKVFNKGRKIIDRAKNAAKRAKALLKKREAACAVGNSFVAGTPVVMADGRRRPIESIRAGDRVRAVDPVTGRVRPEPVLDLITGHGVRRLVTLRVSSDPYGLQSDTITATDNHPFWSLTRHQWVNAGRLQANESLATDGVLRTNIRIAALSRSVRTTTVYNLSVANLHTYQIRSFGTALLVHNTNPCERIVGGQKLSKGRLQHIWKRHVIRKGKYPNKGKFSTTNQSKLLKMVDKTIKQGTKKRSGNTDEYVLDYGHDIGIGMNGKGTSKMKVVVRGGKIITAYPLG